MLAHSEACDRNKEPILAVLRTAFAASRAVLEIGSGTGQHAVYFAGQLPQVTWQPTEMPPVPDFLAQRIRQAALPNLRPPLALDVREPAWARIAAVDAVFSANTLHIMSWESVECLFRGVGAALAGGGVLCIYGPFRYRGQHSSASNLQFDSWLKGRDPDSGVRDFEAVAALAQSQQLHLAADHAMPANNRALVWQRR
jgi:cyclopropane fatty-acyl-phospholipid synthase-like methyltransferase